MINFCDDRQEGGFLQTALYACVYSVLRNKYAKTQSQAAVTLFVIDHECVFLTDLLVECKENGANAETIYYRLQAGRGAPRQGAVHTARTAQLVIGADRRWTVTETGPPRTPSRPVMVEGIDKSCNHLSEGRWKIIAYQRISV